VSRTYEFFKIGTSWTIVGIGALTGLWILITSPTAIFTLGANDTALEIIAGLALICSLFPASVAGLLNRAFAGKWLIVVGALCWIGFLREEFFMAAKQRIPLSIRDALTSLIPGSLVVLYGTFFLVTAKLRWPQLIRPKQSNSEIKTNYEQ
jgi:hypothetical protein